MRRSSMVKLTLLPLLAASALVAHADPPPPPSGPALPPDSLPTGAYTGPPGLAPEGGPPGMTPVMQPMPDCYNDPDQDRCGRPYGIFTNVVHGGFGHYFGTGSGSGGG